MLSQGESFSKEGVVTYTTSQNIYIRFESTTGIEIEDTLFVNNDGVLVSCLIVEQKSTSSCVCKSIGNCKLKKEDVVTHRIRRMIIEIEDEQDSLNSEKVVDDPLVEAEIVEKLNPSYKEKVRARISKATNSFLSSEEDRDRHRAMARFSINADHINDSRFSLESFVIYRKNFIQRNEPVDYQTSFLNVYNLALSYNLDSTSRVSIGRKINRKISSIGPIDGLQVDKYFGDFFTGGVIGFKPDFTGFGLNTNLLEYGAYFGVEKYLPRLRTRTTLGLLEQKNGAAVDRRYAYLQHYSTLFKNLSIFSSVEVDLYQNLNGVKQNKPRLTNLYLSARYKISRKASVMISYDNRKRIIYYETFRTEVEELLADDQVRQGLRTRINIRPIKYVSLGVSYSKRFQSDNQNRSDNINGFLSLSKIPIIKGRLSINVNRNKSNYLESRVLSIRHSRSLIKGKLNGNFYYRLVNYNYFSSELKNKQTYIGGNFSLRLTKTLRFSLLGELSTRDTENNIRINTKLTKRFNKK